MEKREYELMFELEEKHWYFVSKRRIVEKIIRHLNLPPNARILDVGCGTGGNLKMLRKFGLVTGLDKSRQSLRFCEKRGFKDLILGDISNLSHNYHNTYNLITAFDVLEHVLDDQEFLRGITRLLKSKGILLLTVPAFPFLWSDHDRALHHFRRYRKKELAEKIEKVDLRLRYISYSNFFLFLPGLFFRILRRYSKIKKRDSSFSHSDFHYRLPYLLNKILTEIYSFERFLMPRLSFPFGISLICVATKE